MRRLLTNQLWPRVCAMCALGALDEGTWARALLFRDSSLGFCRGADAPPPQHTGDNSALAHGVQTLVLRHRGPGPLHKAQLAAATAGLMGTACGKLAWGFWNDHPGQRPTVPLAHVA